MQFEAFTLQTPNEQIVDDQYEIPNKLKRALLYFVTSPE